MTQEKCFRLVDEKVAGEVGRHYTEEEAHELSQEWQEWYGYPLQIEKVNCC